MRKKRKKGRVKKKRKKEKIKKYVYACKLIQSEFEV